LAFVAATDADGVNAAVMFVVPPPAGANPAMMVAR
jgi:hypothetical protein